MSRGLSHTADRFMLRIARAAQSARDHREMGMRPPFWDGLAEVFIDTARRHRHR